MDVAPYNKVLNSNIHDILFLEGDRFFRELTKTYGTKAMPGSSDLRFIKILLNAIKMPTLNKELVETEINDYL